jgi:hypothetical protein
MAGPNKLPNLDFKPQIVNKVKRALVNFAAK